MAFAIKAKVTGLGPALEKLKGLKDALQRKILRKAMQAGTKPVLRTARQLAPKESGLLRRSMARKTKTYRGSGVVVVIIGPRKGMKQEVGVKRVFREIRGQTRPISKPLASQMRMLRNPVRYAHLVELGTRKNPPKPFLRPAMAQHQGEVAQIVARVVMDEVAKVARGGK